MKGVLAVRAPEAELVDITHDVPAGDVQHAAWVLKTVWSYFPAGTVFLVVGDPEERLRGAEHQIQLALEGEPWGREEGDLERPVREGVEVGAHPLASRDLTEQRREHRDADDRD